MESLYSWATNIWKQHKLPNKRYKYEANIKKLNSKQKIEKENKCSVKTVIKRCGEREGFDDKRLHWGKKPLNQRATEYL